MRMSAAVTEGNANGTPPELRSDQSCNCSVSITEATIRGGSGRWPRAASIDWPSVKTNLRNPRNACERDADMLSAVTNIQLNPVIGYTCSPGMLVSDTRKSPFGFCGQAAAALSGDASTNTPLEFCTRPMLTAPALATFSSA